MLENVAEMPIVDETTPAGILPHESPEDYMVRLAAARRSEQIDPNDEMLKQQAMGTCRDQKTAEPEDVGK